MGDNVTRYAEAFLEKYLVQLDEDIKQLEWLGVDTGEEKSFRELAIKLHYFAHKIAGSAATFGLESSSRSARTLEDLVDGLPESAERFPPNVKAEIADLIGALRQQHAEAISAHARKKDAESSRAPIEMGKRLLAVCGGPMFSQGLNEDLSRLGYGVQRVEGPAELAGFADGPPPAAIMISLDLLSDTSSVDAMAKLLRQPEFSAIPVLFVSDEDGYEPRAKAVRAGGDGFLVAPLDGPACNRKIREIESGQAVRTPRLLIVSGAPGLYAQMSLESSPWNFNVRVLEISQDILRGLADFKPDALLVELDLPGSSGFDLAKVILQADAAKSIPIIFVGRSDQDADAFARVGLEMGDFVMTPCEPDMVVRTVRQRILDHRSPEARRALNIRLRSILDRKTLFALAMEGEGLPAQRSESSSEGAHNDVRVDRQQVSPRVLPKVLIVDDDRLLTDAIQAALMDHGLDVLCAYDGEEAFHIAFAEEPDLILSDYNMPGGSGGHLCRRLKDSVVTRDIPVIIMTRTSVAGGKNYALERELLGRAGVAAFLTKPIDFDELIPEIKRHVSAAREPVLAG